VLPAARAAAGTGLLAHQAPTGCLLRGIVGPRNPHRRAPAIAELLFEPATIPSDVAARDVHYGCNERLPRSFRKSLWSSHPLRRRSRARRVLAGGQTAGLTGLPYTAGRADPARNRQVAPLSAAVGGLVGDTLAFSQERSSFTIVRIRSRQNGRQRRSPGFPVPGCSMSKAVLTVRGVRDIGGRS
jgi:hypothetical protein